MDKCVLGIDLGTSSVKILRKYRNGRVEKMKNTYESALPLGWWNAIEDLLDEIVWEEVEGIGLSSQVGTYLINDESVISWNSEAGRKELEWWKKRYDAPKFLEEISMPHPDIISYPLGRLKYIKENFTNIKRVCQPKEYICEMLTGEWVTDVYSWRGLANLEKGDYSDFFLKEIPFEREKLPLMKSCKEMAGFTKERRLKKNVLPAGIPVFLGMNDYYAGLVGMGIGEPGQMFDVTGTSEHLGVIREKMVLDSVLVSSPYIKHTVHYGVTASSGPSVKYGLKFGKTNCFNLENIIREKPPVFLPYLKGERAPVWNPDARGVFFGIEENCTPELMEYSVMEGVVFSLYHIYEAMGRPEIKRICISGGAATIDCLNQLKAEVFGVPAEIVEENDVSALGACMVAAVGLCWYESLEQAQTEFVKISQTVYPAGQYHQWFERRFEIYKELYSSVNNLYGKWKQVVTDSVEG